MKTRSDFVSNSSSSSFILQDVGFFKHFGITAADIKQALFELYYGSKDAYDKQLANAIKHCDDEINKARQANEDLDGNYYVQRKKELLSDGFGAFVVFDMTDPIQREECFKEWDEHFSGWVAPNEGERYRWNNVIDALKWGCGFDNIEDVANGNDDALISTVYNNKTGTSTDVKFLDGAKLIRYIKEKLGIKSMKEVLHDKACTLMIHFDDNEVYSIKGMTESGKNDDKFCCSDNERTKAANSKWDSEIYSSDRFFEILIKHFIEKGKIDLSNPEFLEYWKVADDDDWYKRHNPGKKYYLNNDMATWKDVVDDCLNCNAIMHEG